jgi:hypothetical protein
MIRSDRPARRASPAAAAPGCPIIDVATQSFLTAASTSSSQQLSARKPTAKPAGQSGIRQTGLQNGAGKSTGGVNRAGYPPYSSSGSSSSLKTAQ